MKVCADTIEALLGLVYLTSGYEASVEIAHELGISLPTDGSETTMAGNSKQVRPALLDVIKSTIGKDSFKWPHLVEEAFTHPSAVDQDVSSYQRLEWVGDAVLCLAAREWLYFSYPSMEVGDLVNMESALVSNETLAYLCCQNGLHTFINHRDQGLPSRLEHYEWCVKELGRGLWGTGECLIRMPIDVCNTQPLTYCAPRSTQSASRCR
jgi:endoribonuclease Dicer